MVIALEGLPGAGKTTSALLLGKRLEAEVVCETTQDHPFLTTVYDDTGRYDLQVELGFLLLHSAAYRTIPVDRRIVTDFSPVKDLFFAEDMLSGSDLEVFERVYEQLHDGKPEPGLVVFLDAAPELCMERIRERLARDHARRFEEGLEIDRLRRISDTYRRRIEELGERVVRLPISGELSKEDVVDRLAEIVKAQVPE
jgi:deoxyadenosine/deoxycytidine kinase